ncbi:MAG: GTP 3',8-cyclase MoaA [Acidobacteriota bacterium]
MTLLDSRARPLRDLRVSVTDRCNLRCTYCMPREVFGPTFPFLGHDELLRYEEISRLVRILAPLGARKIRVTGGEPLVRRDVDQLIAQLAAIPGVEDLTLTTNGVLLPQFAQRLRAAGLSRVTVSLDALDDAVFQRMNGSGVSVDTVLRGIDAANAAGLAPIKVNAVVQRGVNDHLVLDLARHFRGSRTIVRFIEYMDVGNTNHWRRDQVVTAREIIACIAAEFPLVPLDPTYRGEVAERWAYADGAGEIGVIASVSQPFCGDCTRARLSPEGRLFTCLFARDGFDLRALLRGGASDEELEAAVRSVWTRRDDRYSELRASLPTPVEKVEMSHIGG